MTTRYSADLLSEVRLSSVKGVGPLLRKRLIEAFGDASQVLAAAPQDLCRIEGVGPSTARAIQAGPTAESVGAMLAAAAAEGIRALTPTSDDYPDPLLEIYDPQPVLYCRGAIHPDDSRAVAIVGTRRATRYGLRQAEVLASGLARAGVTVVSGLARGIDGVAHRAALGSGGRTLAALAGGLSRIYPPEHDRLAEAVAAGGALLAEAPPPMPPMSGSFPQRNRIISGLSLAVVVIEAAERSGALITARHAAEQGRDVMAVPGAVDNPQTLGCLRLIQEGAKLVVTVDDILEELEAITPRPLSGGKKAPSRRARPAPASTAPAPPPAPNRPARDWPEPERLVLAGLSPESTSIDSLVDSTGLPVDKVLTALSRLEAEGEVRRLSGALVSKA